MLPAGVPGEKPPLQENQQLARPGRGRREAPWAGRLLDRHVAATVVIGELLEELLLGTLETEREDPHVAQEVELLHPLVDRTHDLRGVLRIGSSR